MRACDWMWNRICWRLWSTGKNKYQIKSKFTIFQILSRKILLTNAVIMIFSRMRRLFSQSLNKRITHIITYIERTHSFVLGNGAEDFALLLFVISFHQSAVVPHFIVFDFILNILTTTMVGKALKRWRFIGVTLFV